MKSLRQVTMLIVLLLISGVISQDLVLTSDTSVEIEVDQPVQPVKEVEDKIKTPGNIVNIMTLTNFDQMVSTTPETLISEKSIQNATFADPGAEAIAQKKLIPLIQSTSISTEASKKQAALVNNAKWIYGGSRRLVSFITPCFHNPCPKGQYTIYFSSTCRFTIHLVDTLGNIVDTIGSGLPWASYVFRFYVPCGKYRIRISMNCTCACPHVRFNLYQDRQGCYTCSDEFRHTYNPKTCKCECANKGPCSRPQTWYDFPSCGCGCPYRPPSCPSNKYYNKKTCQCECLPKCCTLYSTTHPDCICLEAVPFNISALNNTIQT